MKLALKFLQLLLICAGGHYLPAQVLELAPAKLELGRITQEKSLTREVTLTNCSSSPLLIQQLNADCGCTTSQLEKASLPPGQSTSLRVTFDSRHYLGNIVRHVQIITNQGIFSLPLEAVVVQYLDWEISPQPLMLPPTLVTQIASGEVRLRHLGAKPAAVLSASSAQPWLTAEVLPAAPDGEQVIRLTKATAAPPGTHTVALQVISSDPGTAPLQLNVIVPVASGLHVAPSPVILPRAKAGEISKASFRVIGWTDPAPPVVTSDQGTIFYQGAVNQEHSYEISLPAAATGTTLATIRIFRGSQLQLEISAVLSPLP